MTLLEAVRKNKHLTKSSKHKLAFDSVLYAAQKLKEEEEQREDALNAAKVKQKFQKTLVLNQI